MQIRAFKGAGTESGLRDRELEKLGDYVCDPNEPEEYAALTFAAHGNCRKRYRLYYSGPRGRSAREEPQLTNAAVEEAAAEYSVATCCRQHRVCKAYEMSRAAI